MKHQLITAQGLAIALAISLCAFATQSYSQTQPQIPARKPQVKLSGTTKDDKGKSIEFCNIVLKRILLSCAERYPIWTANSASRYLPDNTTYRSDSWDTPHSAKR